MANLSLRHIYKVYSNGCKAVSDFNLEIKNNEFVVFVGPSGCGKSTTLRMVAGLEEISAGELYIDNVLVNNIEPKDRDISMVFQNYALYPHMTVYDNMAFGLKLRHVPQEEIHKKVLWAAKALKLTDYLDKKPRAMSGGQRQRVALGRAILRNPKVFLLDEPLSNLDAKLRTEMRTEIAKLHDTIKTTFIYVTHDQVEAMTLGTKVVVMKQGFIQQVDTPQNLYRFPINKFVAGFIGTPQMNFFNARLKRVGQKVEIKLEDNSTRLSVDANYLAGIRPYYLRGEEPVTIGLRCENISLDKEIVKHAKHKIKVRISHFEDLGAETLAYCNLNLKKEAFSTDIDTQIIIKLFKKDYSIKQGDIVEAALDMSIAHYFDKDTEESIKPRIPRDNVLDCSVKNNQIEFLSQKIKLPSAIKCNDINNVELFIPTDSIDFKGKIPAKVVESKTIDNTHIVSLKCDNHIFYAITDQKFKKDQNVKIGFDIKRLSVWKRDQVVIENLTMSNNFVGTVTNISNEKKATHYLMKYYKNSTEEQIDKLKHEKDIELGKLGLNNVILKDYRKEYKEALKKAKFDLSDKIGRDALGKKKIKEEKANYKKKIAELREDYLKKCIEFRKNKLKIVVTDASKAKAEALNKELEKKVQHLNNMLDEKEKLYEQGRTLSSAYCQKCASDDQKVFQKEIAQVEAKYSKLIATYTNEIKKIADKKSLKRKELLVKLKNTKTEYAKEKDLVIGKSKTFFINIYGSCLKLDPAITRKIVQALGVSIFNVQYRFQIGLDSLKVVNKPTTPALSVVVDELLDYGKEKFVRAVINDQKIVIRVNKAYKKGDVIKVCYDLNNISIFENKLDIRLY